ncbi:MULTISPECIES: hypothetical protein [unclassified Lentimonas]|uniref:hypothetical protein n=1 Tax=unclassified Lentimonas TaxID=2630993 RepID=UPI0013206DC1|nr:MULTISPECIES: hypothetical protein [unclassified Lentimonas]CAA6692810.1 Unannotated [Lentimonas sp. CC19]CAA6695026.1 Unannotated [Lentimonas sp. CC10]CAA7069639.1 Unannotated [Lentimonas sp. CC11]
MKINFLIIILLTSCLAHAENYPFIRDDSGTFSYAGGQRTLSIESSDMGLSYSWTMKTPAIAKTIGPKEVVEITSGWFFYVDLQPNMVRQNKQNKSKMAPPNQPFD